MVYREVTAGFQMSLEARNTAGHAHTGHSLTVNATQVTPTPQRSQTCKECPGSTHEGHTLCSGRLEKGRSSVRG